VPKAAFAQATVGGQPLFVRPKAQAITAKSAHAPSVAPRQQDLYSHVVAAPHRYNHATRLKWIDYLGNVPLPDGRRNPHAVYRPSPKARGNRSRTHFTKPPPQPNQAATPLASHVNAVGGALAAPAETPPGSQPCTRHQQAPLSTVAEVQPQGWLR
jgi:hypothetical protein